MYNNSTLLTGSTLSFFYIIIIFALFLLYTVLGFIVFYITNIFLSDKLKITKILKGSIILGFFSSVGYPMALSLQKYYESKFLVYKPSYIPFIGTFSLISILIAFIVTMFMYRKMLNRIRRITLILILLVILIVPCILMVYR